MAENGQELDGQIHPLVPRAWIKQLRQMALDRDSSAAELVRLAIAEKYDFPYEPRYQPTTDLTPVSAS